MKRFSNIPFFLNSNCSLRVCSVYAEVLPGLSIFNHEWTRPVLSRLWSVHTSWGGYFLFTRCLMLRVAWVLPESTQLMRLGWESTLETAPLSLFLPSVLLQVGEPPTEGLPWRRGPRSAMDAVCWLVKGEPNGQTLESWFQFSFMPCQC